MSASFGCNGKSGPFSDGYQKLIMKGREMLAAEIAARRRTEEARPKAAKAACPAKEEKLTDMQHELCKEEIETIKRQFIGAEAELLPFTCVSSPKNSFFNVCVWGSVPRKALTYEIQAPDECSAMREGVRRFIATYVTGVRTTP